METQKIRRVLVGIDQGNLSEHALPLAMELASTFDAKLDVLHAVDIHPPSRGTAAAKRWAETSAKAMAAARKAVEGRLSLTVEHPRFAELPPEDYLRTVVGRPATVLLHFANEHAVDLIVLGGHRHRKLFDFGGTARAILGQSPCPVWIQMAPMKPIERILAAIDLSESNEQVLSAARTLGQMLGASVEVLHCFQPPTFAYEAVGEVGAAELMGSSYVIESVRDDESKEFTRTFEEFDWGGVEASSTFVEGEPHEQILACEERCDLLVLGTHGRTGLARAVMGSEAYKVVKGARGPIVVVPQKATELLG